MCYERNVEEIGHEVDSSKKNDCRTLIGCYHLFELMEMNEFYKFVIADLTYDISESEIVSKCIRRVNHVTVSLSQLRIILWPISRWLSSIKSLNP